MSDDTLFVDEAGRGVRLSDYPPDFIETLEALSCDPEDWLLGGEWHPEECPSTMVPHWAVSTAFINGQPVHGRLLGIAYECHIGVRQDGSFLILGCEREDMDDDDLSDMDVAVRLDWINDNCKGGYTAWWRRRDTGDGVLLDDYAYLVAFHDPADDAAFLAAFPGAGA